MLVQMKEQSLERSADCHLNDRRKFGDFTVSRSSQI